MLLALDIGNTNVTVGIIKSSKIVEIHRIDSTTSANVGLNNLNLAGITNAIISSVVPTQTIDYKKACEQLLNISPFIVKYNNIQGLELDVEKPSSVGADRNCSTESLQASKERSRQD